jgi:hypothetical protein
LAVVNPSFVRAGPVTVNESIKMRVFGTQLRIDSSLRRLDANDQLLSFAHAMCNI